MFYGSPGTKVSLSYVVTKKVPLHHVILAKLQWKAFQPNGTKKLGAQTTVHQGHQDYVKNLQPVLFLAGIFEMFPHPLFVSLVHRQQEGENFKGILLKKLLLLHLKKYCCVSSISKKI